MKVRETSNTLSSTVEVQGKDDRKVSENKEASFQSQLKKIEDQDIDERVNTLANKIIEQGEKLGKKVDIRELKIYKNLISEFLGEAVGNSHKFSKESFLDRRGRYKVYANVKKINCHLDDLTQDVLSGQKDHIKILQRLDDIRGLILDMVM